MICDILKTCDLCKPFGAQGCEIAMPGYAMDALNLFTNGMLQPDTLLFLNASAGIMTIKHDMHATIPDILSAELCLNFAHIPE